MSKSVEGSYINLTDSREEIQKKIRSIPTATEAGGEMSRGVAALFTFGKLFLKDTAEYERQFKDGSLQFSAMKDAIAEAVSEELKPLQEKRKELERDAAYIDSVIKEGAEKARQVASVTVKEVKEKMGLS